MIRVEHYREKCLGCAYCVEVASSLFEVNDKDGKVDLINSAEHNGVQSVEVPDVFSAEAGQAASVCPAKIIKVK